MINGAVYNGGKNLTEVFFFSIYRGTVVTGRVTNGTLKVGNEVEILGYGKSFKVKVNGIYNYANNIRIAFSSSLIIFFVICSGIEMFRKTLEEACAGDQMGILTKGVKKTDVRRGMVICKPGTIKQHDNFEAQLYVLTKNEGGLGNPVTGGKSFTVFSKTWDCASFVAMDGDLMKQDMVMPGEHSGLTIKLIKTMVLAENQHFTMRMGNKTIGTGKITKILPNMTVE